MGILQDIIERTRVNNPKMDFSEFSNFTQGLLGSSQQDTNEPAQILDQLSRQNLVPAIINSKLLYDTADNEQVQQEYGMNADQLRQYAHNEAENARRIATENGVDLSPYDSGVTLRDAQNNLMANDYRALNSLFNNDMTSDEFYSQKYKELRDAGLSHRRANYQAGEAAKLYKARRKAKLNSALNTYGFNEDNTLNRHALQILSMLEPGDETLTALYTSQAPGLKDVYQADTNMAMKAIDQSNLFARMAQEFANQKELADIMQRYGLINMNAKHNLNERSAENAFGRTERGKENDLSRAVERQRLFAEIAQNNDDVSYDKRYARAKSFGATDSEAGLLMFGINPYAMNRATSKGTAYTNEQINAAKAVIQSKQKQYTDDYSGFDSKAYAADPMVQDAMKVLQSVMYSEQTSRQSNGSTETPSFEPLTANWNVDKPTIDAMDTWIQSNYPEYQGKDKASIRKQMIYNYLIDPKVNVNKVADDYIKGAIGID